MYKKNAKCWTERGAGSEEHINQLEDTRVKVTRSIYGPFWVDWLKANSECELTYALKILSI